MKYFFDVTILDGYYRIFADFRPIHAGAWQMHHPVNIERPNGVYYSSSGQGAGHQRKRAMALMLTLISART
jgi:hypothetical protein